jgi:5,10-methylenetetrahydromethanopterin reductase
MAYIGRKPLPLDEFGGSLEQIQRYLRGEAVDCEGYASLLQWLPSDLKKVPMSVAATGPRVIRLAARVADSITFSVGADPVRLNASIELAQQERAGTGMPPLRLGAYLNAVAHPDIKVARDLVRGRLGVYARFSTMDKNVLASLSDQDRKVADNLVSTYDMQSHATSGARHEAALVDDFVDRFGVVGPSEHVAERLKELVALGLDHVIIVGHSRNTPPEVLAESSRRFCEQVIPAVRDALP